MDIPTDWELYGDPFYWTQILFNLVENALKQHTEPGLSITVAAAKTQDALSLIHIFQSVLEVDLQDLLST